MVFTIGTTNFVASEQHFSFWNIRLVTVRFKCGVKIEFPGMSIGSFGTCKALANLYHNEHCAVVELISVPQEN